MQTDYVLAYALLAVVVAFLAVALWRATHEQHGHSRVRRWLRRTRRHERETINAQPLSSRRGDIEAPSCDNPL